MKWIVFAIIVFIVPMTYLTLRYRKPAKAFEPYHDLKDRANTTRLLSAGYQRIALVAQRPADPARPAAAVAVPATPGGLPAELAATLLEKPLLPAEITSATAAPLASALLPYPIQLTCTVPDDKQQLAGAQLYLRGEEIFLVPDFERLGGGLLARSRESVVLLTVPAGALKAGRYQTTLVGQRVSRTWTLEVR